MKTEPETQFTIDTCCIALSNTEYRPGYHVTNLCQLTPHMMTQFPTMYSLGIGYTGLPRDSQAYESRNCMLLKIAIKKANKNKKR